MLDLIILIRVLSNASGEKRKQKLALLDQILNIEDPTNNPPSSPSDAGGGSSLSGLSIAATSREASRSPAPPTQDHAAAATSLPPATWHMDGSYHSTIRDPFEGDMWLGEYDHHGSGGGGCGMFGAHQDFMTTYHHVHHHSAADAAALGDYSACYPAPTTHQHAPPVAAEPKLPLQSEQNSAMAVALDAYSRLNSTQQDQMLDIIHKRRRPDHYIKGSNIRTWGENI